LIELMCGVRPPSEGHLELDGIDLREIRADSLREHLGVARAVEIFQGDIGDNVHLHRPHVNARDVRDALDAVGLLDELLNLPEGLRTQLSTGGAPLTHSQAVRLMIARAIVARPRLLLIDGLLDALPDAVQDHILDRLLAPEAPWTVVIATNRDLVRQRCSRVVELAPPWNARQRRVERVDGADHAVFNEIAASSCR
jgi:ABC-type bacteriocin/lantibiotic exporter with double-glycine peptidase domain